MAATTSSTLNSKSTHLRLLSEVKRVAYFFKFANSVETRGGVTSQWREKIHVETNIVTHLLLINSLHILEASSGVCLWFWFEIEVTAIRTGVAIVQKQKYVRVVSN